jgi:glycosyltransferase involved in cell wall biosynthesis
VAERARPRLLLLFLAAAARISGGDRHLLQMAARWTAQVDLAVAAPPGAVVTIREHLGDVPLTDVGSSPPIGPRLALEYVRRSILALGGRLPDADVTIAASHFTPDAAGLTAMVRGGALGVAYVYHLVGERRGLNVRTLWSRADERVGLALLRRHADLVFVSNEPAANALLRRGFEPVRTDVGIELDALRGASRERTPHQALFLGRMMPSKGVRDAVETWARVRAMLPEARLVLAGEGPEREPAMALARDLGIEGALEWRGFVSEDEKVELLHESSVLLAPSHEEGWGIAVCEALASGLPVVAYRLPTLDELFPDAYLDAPLGDTDALADAAVRVLEDPATAKSLSRRGERTAARYDVDRVATDELEEILRRLSSHAPVRRKTV